MKANYNKKKDNRKQVQVKYDQQAGIAQPISEAAAIAAMDQQAVIVFTSYKVEILKLFSVSDLAGWAIHKSSPEEYLEAIPKELKLIDDMVIKLAMYMDRITKNYNLNVVVEEFKAVRDYATIIHNGINQKDPDIFHISVVLSWMLWQIAICCINSGIMEQIVINSATYICNLTTSAESMLRNQSRSDNIVQTKSDDNNKPKKDKSKKSKQDKDKTKNDETSKSESETTEAISTAQEQEPAVQEEEPLETRFIMIGNNSDVEIVPANQETAVAITEPVVIDAEAALDDNDVADIVLTSEDDIYETDPAKIAAYYDDLSKSVMAEVSQTYDLILEMKLRPRKKEGYITFGDMIKAIEETDGHYRHDINSSLFKAFKERYDPMTDIAKIA